MRRFAYKVREFLLADDGPTAVEYAVMLGLILMVCIVAVATFGTATCSMFTSASSKL
jgi:pilus assembly protein Flp/PilA